MKYAPLVLLLASSSALANGNEWKRQPITPAEYCEIRRIANLTSLPKCQLDAVAESERHAFNQQTLLQYNRVLPPLLPMAPTPDVAPPSRRGFHRFFH